MYPKLLISLEGIENNSRIINDLCNKDGIKVTGVVKSSNSYDNSYVPVVQAMKRGGIDSIGDSRMRTIIRMREEGYQGQIMLIRVPMICELEDLVRYADSSLNSERQTLLLLNQEAMKQNKRHGVILMADLGDLREGIEDEEELVETALMCEELEGLELLGIGTNLGCYGAIVPNEDNLGSLVNLARIIEDKIGRELEIVSGGATSTLPLVLEGSCPEGINHLRIGEAILVARDLDEIWKVDIPGIRKDNYIIQAQVIELKEKYSHPVGKIFVDAFGKTPSFEDRGRRKRALVALGKRDVGDLDGLTPLIDGVEVMGGSSDHGILDVEDAVSKIKLGDILSFNLYYGAMMNSIESCSVFIEYRED